MKNYVVYILVCSDGSYYTGMTSNLEQRFNEHQYGIDPLCYTYSRRPLRIVWFMKFGSRDQAFSVERQIKGWSRRKKKALIEGRIGDLKYYSRSNQRKRRRGL